MKQNIKVKYEENHISLHLLHLKNPAKLVMFRSRHTYIKPKYTVNIESFCLSPTLQIHNKMCVAQIYTIIYDLTMCFHSKKKCSRIVFLFPDSIFLGQRKFQGNKNLPGSKLDRAYLIKELYGTCVMAHQREAHIGLFHLYALSDNRAYCKVKDFFFLSLVGISFVNIMLVKLEQIT
jgi:hypothetical protein